ncbi:hypothetical protein COU17_00455 [Candidatus Kaiserbacteria bacterium CG10_big_fil_rev_8_21_14_0_10_49_17]|uniref:Ig-like domain-containing protein n=1 Tax=Candidatus Kaiserbacteria bacterium CG10_big_fil_rev_8_21_14_0_10_49_17 TaxID=1974609 RepID=A0A2M6WF92_9BACT|nr:MAG: hypothetical protein COU17_00455 [Candidatus Kaiserbacteria bacterium CG10_big_fil_rev_8_21_14_0_10_49_17]
MQTVWRGLVLCVLLFSAPFSAHALSASWSSTIPGSIQFENPIYYWYQIWNATTYPGGWQTADFLTSPTVSVQYYVDVIDTATQQPLPQNADVSVGQVIEFRPRPLSDSNITWSSSSVPGTFNGHWEPRAVIDSTFNTPYAGPDNFVGVEYNLYYTVWLNPPSPRQSTAQEKADSTCPASEYLGTTRGRDVYASLSLDEPVMSVEHNGSAGLSCDSTGFVCTVTSPGSIESRFTFEPVDGHFYYRYDSRDIITKRLTIRFWDVTIPVGTYSETVNNPFCAGSNTPMRRVGESGAFSVAVPAQSIVFVGDAKTPNSAPTPPVISGAASSYPSVLTQFTFLSTDPDGDTLRYGIDWDENASVDEWVPSSGYVSSGSSGDSSYGWGSAGSYTFQALAEDEIGNRSAWSTHNITINPALPVSVDLRVNGENSATVSDGESALLTWSSNNASSCSGAGFSTGGQTHNSTGLVVVPSAPSTVYRILCSGIGSPAEDSVEVYVASPTVDIAVIPADSLIRAGDSIVLSWSAVDITKNSCELSGPGIVRRQSNNLTQWDGTTSVRVDQKSTFTIVCESAQGDVSDSITVGLIPDFEEF